MVLDDRVFPEVSPQQAPPHHQVRAGSHTPHQEPVRVSVPAFGAIKSLFSLILLGPRTSSDGFAGEGIFLHCSPVASPQALMLTWKNKTNLCARRGTLGPAVCLQANHTVSLCPLSLVSSFGSWRSFMSTSFFPASQG